MKVSFEFQEGDVMSAKLARVLAETFTDIANSQTIVSQEEEKPKRKTKKDSKPEAQVPVVEESKAEAPAPETEQAPAQPTEVKPVTVEEWRRIFEAKRSEFGLLDGQLNTEKRGLFNDYVHKLSEAYGNRVPSKLSDEARGRFVLEFNSIEETLEGFRSTYTPF